MPGKSGDTVNRGMVNRGFTVLLCLQVLRCRYAVSVGGVKFAVALASAVINIMRSRIFAQIFGRRSPENTLIDQLMIKTCFQVYSMATHFISHLFHLQLKKSTM
jgi:hypothetical protein